MQVHVRPVLIATHLEQSIDLADQKQGAINKNDLAVFIRLMQGSSSAPSRALKDLIVFRVPVVCQWMNLM
jgi:hypothetical protein